MPAEHEKIVVRPRGGMVIKNIEPLAFNRAMAAAAKVDYNAFKTDTTYPNVGQNILVISTPSQERAVAYANVRAIFLQGRQYEIYAYRAAPENTTKGLIYNISQSYSQAELEECVINEANPTAIAIKRIGETRTVVVLFEGQRVPQFVNFAGYMSRCKLYKQHREVCRTCGQVGHRRDVCPRPNVTICFACGIVNPPLDHEAHCQPKCKLCGGPHASGTGNCPNKYKTPYIERKREHERKMEESKMAASKGKVTFSSGNFPPLGKQQQGKPGQGRDKSKSPARSREREHSGTRRPPLSGKSWANVAANKQRLRTASADAKDHQTARHPSIQREGKKNNTDVAELKALVNQLQGTIATQQKMIEQLVQAARTPQLQQQQQPIFDGAKSGGWQLGQVPQPPTLTPPKTTVPVNLQPLAKMRKRAVTSQQGDEESEDTMTSECDNVIDEGREDNNINYGARIRKQGQRVDRLAGQVDRLASQFRALDARMTTLEDRVNKGFARLEQLIVERLGGASPGQQEETMSPHNGPYA